MKKNILALLLGCLFALALLVAGETFFRLNRQFGWLKNTPGDIYPGHASQAFDDAASRALFEKLHAAPVFDWQSRLSPAEGRLSQTTEGEDDREKGPVSCCIGPHQHLTRSAEFTSRVYTARSHRLIYEAHYRFDEFGRRITPVRPRARANILFFGGSFALGEGVNDEESPAYQLGLRRPDTQVYNLAVAGGSPNETLYELSEKRPPRLRDVGPGRVLVLYTYMDNHLERLFCRSLCLRPENSWILGKPYYERVNGRITLQGTFAENRPWINQVDRWINASALLDFFHVAWPPRFTQWHFNFFADVMKEAEAQAHRLFPGSEFYVVFYPGAASQAFAPQLKAASEKRGLHVLDYSDLNQEIFTGGKGDIPGNGHPSPITQYVFAYLLDRDLPKP